MAAVQGYPWTAVYTTSTYPELYTTSSQYRYRNTNGLVPQDLQIIT